MERFDSWSARTGAWVAHGLTLLMLFALPVPTTQAAPPDRDVVEEILAILAERGLIGDEEQQRLSARYASSEEERKSWLQRLHFYGDFRARGEAFFYEEDPNSSNELPNRYRARYRLRLGAEAEINDWSSVHVRLASSEDDIRSNNQSLGRDDPDFDLDSIFIDRAYATLRAPSAWLPIEGASAVMQFGKMGNPFLWKESPDMLLWDADIAPEGMAVLLDAPIDESLGLYFNTGYFIIDENSGGSDPHMIAAQFGGDLAASETVTLGARASYFGFRSVDMAFIERGVDGTDGSTNSAGNIVDGIAGDDTDPINVGELSFYARCGCWEDWPVTVFGHVAQNFSAVSSNLVPMAGKEDLAWSAGIDVGDKKKFVNLGLGYWYVEANAFPSQYIDSDILDGITNRQGFSFWLLRQLARNVDFKIEAFLSEDIDDGRPAFDDSLSGSNRLRLRSDLSFKF